MMGLLRAVGREPLVLLVMHLPNSRVAMRFSLLQIHWRASFIQTIDTTKSSVEIASSEGEILRCRWVPVLALE